MFPAIEKMLGDTGISDDRNIMVYGKAADLYENAVTHWILEFLGCNSPHLSCAFTILTAVLNNGNLLEGNWNVGDSSLPKAQFKARVVVRRNTAHSEGDSIFFLVKIQ